VSLKPKQEAYSTFMNSFTKPTIASNAHEQANLLAELNRMESAYFLFGPFLPTETRNEMFTKFSEFMELCGQRAKSMNPNAGVADDASKVFVEQITPANFLDQEAAQDRV
jgi:hypothetical protein